MTNFKCYLKLRKVCDFETLTKLIVSDRLFKTFMKETSSDISIRQSDSCFNPLDLRNKADLYFPSR